MKTNKETHDQQTIKFKPIEFQRNLTILSLNTSSRASTLIIGTFERSEQLESLSRAVT